MGWDFQHRDKGTSNVDFFRTNYAEGYELLDGATVGGAFYAAVRRPDGLVMADVTLIRWVPRDHWNFGKKDMSESWGPNEARCPARILDILSPTDQLYGPVLYKKACDSHYDCSWKADEPHVNQRDEAEGSRASADQWRAACREALSKRAQVKVGTIIRLPTASTGEFFEVVDLRRNVFRHAIKRENGTFEIGYGRTRIPWWRSGSYEVVA